MTTREEVTALLQARPDATFATIAREVGISRERVRQIAKSTGAPPRLRARPYAPCDPGPKRQQPSSSQGRVSELRAASDLISRGYWVYWPLTTYGPDLVAVSRDRKLVLLVEVKSGRCEGGRVAWNRPGKDADLLAIVTKDDVFYRRPALPEEPLELPPFGITDDGGRALGVGRVAAGP